MLLLSSLRKERLRWCRQNGCTRKKTRSYWPPWKSSAKTQAAVRARMTPTNEYTSYSVRVFYETGKLLNDYTDIN